MAVHDVLTSAAVESDMTALAIEEVLGISRLRQLIAAGQLESELAQRRISQADVAAMIGASPATVSRWCTGDRMPRTQAALRLAALLWPPPQSSEPNDQQLSEGSHEIDSLVDQLATAQEIIERQEATIRTLDALCKNAQEWRQNEIIVLQQRIQALRRQILAIDQWLDATSRDGQRQRITPA